MGIRPGERHPARALTQASNFLGKLLLDATALEIGTPNQLDIDAGMWENMDGVTHFHHIEGEQFVVDIMTHYVPETETYYLLEIVKAGYGDLNTSAPKPEFILSRGKTQEQLEAQISPEPSDEHIASVINLFDELSDTLTHP